MSDARPDRQPTRVRRRRRRSVLSGALLLLLGGLLGAGCTLLENPDDHFSSADTSDVASDGDMVSSSELCTSYCTQFLELCASDPSNTYADTADCLTQCETLPAGSVTDYSRNSINCRMNHFGAAISLPADHCPHASFGGGEQCVGDAVSPCEAYCGLLSENCPQTFETLAVEGGLSATAMCVKGCGMFLPSPGGAGEPIYVTDSIECRQAFLDRMSAPNMPGLYCQAAMPTDAQACRGAIGVTESLCEAFCLIALNECPGELPFADFAACRDGCSGEPQEAVECALDALVRDDAPACDEIAPIAGACGVDCPSGQVCGSGCGAAVPAAQCACGPGTVVCDENDEPVCFDDAGGRVAQRDQLAELCGNGIDDDCDGTIDAEDTDCTSCTDGGACGTGCGDDITAEQCACGRGTLTCAAGMPEACTDSQGSPVIFPFTLAEACDNGVDDNCDGRIDEAGCN